MTTKSVHGAAGRKGLGPSVRGILVNLFIAAQIYLTVCGMVSSWGLRIDNGSLPNVRILADLFHIYGVFGSVSRGSREYQVFGVRERRPAIPLEPDAAMIDLHAYEQFFPQPRGEAHRRFGLLSYTRDERRHRAAYREMLDAMQRIHNRDHPDNPVEQVVIYRLDWPHDRRGYDHRRSEGRFRVIAFN